MTPSYAEPEAPGEPPDADDEIRIGISACLLGEKVRFDGGHKRNDFIVRTLGSMVTFVPVCPEVEIGLGTPRESIRLVRDGKEARLVAPKAEKDHTDAMLRFSRQASRDLAAQDLSGFIFKKDSPSCGLFRVRLYDHNGVPSRDGRGLFAATFADSRPEIPLEEEGRLNDPRLRENFFERVFAYRRLRELFRGRWGMGAVVRFHTNEKMHLLAHSPALYRELGRLVATAKDLPRKEFATSYQEKYREALATLATRGKHANVLQHMAGHLKKLIDDRGRAELKGIIDDFRRGLIPLIVPVTLIRHHVADHGVGYLQGQSYLEPHPKELMLRNHV